MKQINNEMAVVKSFCFYFSCRLGSLFVGVINIIQILVWFGICIDFLVHSEELKKYIKDLLEDEDLDLSDISDTLINIKNDPDTFFNCLITFFSFFGFSAIAMMYGVYKLKLYIVYPFVIIDFFYITSLLVIYVMGLLILKTNDHGLGPLILFSIIGEFIFLYKYYTWFVVLSYCQIVRELKKEGKFNFLAQDKIAMYPKRVPAYPAPPAYPYATATAYPRSNNY